MQPFAIIALVLILTRVVTELWLSGLNQRHVRERANEVPFAFRGVIDAAMYRRSVDYTLAKGRFGDIVNVFDTVVLIAVLFSGLLPWGCGGCHRLTIASAADRAGDHHAAFQQVHATARRRIAPTPFCTGAAYPFSYAQHRSDGRE